MHRLQNKLSYYTLHIFSAKIKLKLNAYQDYALYDILNHESAIENMSSYTIIYNMRPWERSRNINCKVFCLNRVEHDNYFTNKEVMSSVPLIIVSSVYINNPFNIKIIIVYELMFSIADSWFKMSYKA
jgi:hypothetical protein